MVNAQELRGRIADFTSLLKSGPLAGRPFVEAFSTASEAQDASQSFFPEFLDDFKTETVTILGKIRAVVDSVAKEPVADFPQLAEAYRVCHMLKGSAATMGFNRLSYLAHGLERVFEDLKEKRLQLDGQIVPVLQEGLALVEETLESMKGQI